jgi:hypothetical protein
MEQNNIWKRNGQMVKTFCQVSGNGILFNFFHSKPVVDHVLNYLSPVHTIATYEYSFNYQSFHQLIQNCIVLKAILNLH